MKDDDRFFDDMARLAGGALGGIAEMKHEIEAQIHAQVEKLLRNMKLATREEFEIVREMAIKARQEQEEMKERLAEIEKELANQSPKKKPSKGTAKKATKK